MKLSFLDYKDRMRACWLGKNIGGVLGAPFEGRRGVFEVQGYVQELKGIPPANDDLDLQLVWLNAVEKYGARVNASILGEYWLSFITPNWVEYGSGKNNLKMGLLPPLSGHVGNSYRDSCGCFIRSEIWACLAPGRPEVAARYAYEDAIVDHSGEGLYAEVFCATVQSAAFVEADRDTLIEVGLSYIPEDCGVARGIQAVRAAHRAGRDFRTARLEVMTLLPGTFGVQHTKLKDIPADVPVGRPGYDAPSNIGLMMIGWLYGEGDFGKSLCLANNCGEDTDCTCATLGAILGIIYGTAGIPAAWRDPLGDVITVGCVNWLNGGLTIPQTVTELTDRMLRVLPAFVGPEICDILAGPEGYTIEVQTGAELYCIKEDQYVAGINGNQKPVAPRIPELLRRSPYSVAFEFSTFSAVLEYGADPFYRLNQPRKLKLTLIDSANFGYNNHQWFTLKWYLPDGVRVLPASESTVLLEATYRNKAQVEFEILVEKTAASRIELLIDISVHGRHTHGAVKVILLREN